MGQIMKTLFSTPPGSGRSPFAVLCGVALAALLSGLLGSVPVAAQATSACVPDDTTLCLSDGRFEVSVTWEDFEGGQGVGHAMPETGDSGWFWFFDPDNIELLVKVLDARTVNGKFWVFYGSLSNVEYTIRVVDTQTGEEKSYFNPPRRFASVGDTAAFPLDDGTESTVAAVDFEALGSGSPATSPASTPATPAAPPGTEVRELRPRPDRGEAGELCTSDPTTLCLQDGRFRVQVVWKDFQGGSGEGRAVPRRDDSGFFWFFEPDNLELVVKVLDGRGVNGNFWFFYGALSNVEYEVTVEDVLSGRRMVFENPSGRFASFGDTELFDGSEFCGGFAGFPCLDGQFCDFDPGSCRVADVAGTCRDVPELCPAVFDPVCGCDGRTYGNDCERRRARVAKDHDGPCDAELCAGIAGLPCEDGEFCEIEPGTCRMPDAAGRCEPRPDACTEELAPVCGCDDVTYDNDCFRRAAGVAKLHDGACEGAACNPRLGFPCTDGLFCEAEVGACGSADGDATGACAVRPAECPADFVPVCGCDGSTYGNDCERRRAGVSKNHDGMCEGQVCGTIAGIPCPGGQFCEFAVGACEVADAPGLCRVRPEVCILLLDPVCGCDGVTYDNDCFRRSAGVSKDHDGPCEARP